MSTFIRGTITFNGASRNFSKGTKSHRLHLLCHLPTFPAVELICPLYSSGFIWTEFLIGYVRAKRARNVCPFVLFPLYMIFSPLNCRMSPGPWIYTPASNENEKRFLIDRQNPDREASGKSSRLLVRTLEVFQGTHVLGASPSRPCDSSPFLLPRDALVHSAVLRLHVVRPSVCPSVCLSVCDVGGSGSHRLEIFETNCTIN